jgi:hypothetical protein
VLVREQVRASRETAVSLPLHSQAEAGPRRDDGVHEYVVRPVRRSPRWRSGDALGSNRGAAGHHRPIVGVVAALAEPIFSFQFSAGVPSSFKWEAR